jgi:hypothetical protein
MSFGINFFLKSQLEERLDKISDEQFAIYQLLLAAPSNNTSIDDDELVRCHRTKKMAELQVVKDILRAELKEVKDAIKAEEDAIQEEEDAIRAKQNAWLDEEDAIQAEEENWTE